MATTTRKRQRQREGDLDSIALKQQSSSARQSSRLRRNAPGNAAVDLLGSQIGGPGYGRGSNSGQHLGRVPSFGDASLTLKPPAADAQTTSRRGGDKGSPRHGTGSLRSLAVDDPQESMIIRRTMSISRQRPQISTAEV